MHRLLTFPFGSSLVRGIQGLAIAGVLLGSSGVGRAQDAPIAPSALKEIEEIYAFKDTLSPAEQKMSTGLVLASRRASGRPLGRMAKFYSPPKMDGDGQVLVDVLGYASARLLGSRTVAAFDDLAGERPAATYQHTHLRAHVRASLLAQLAAEPDVTSLREAAPHRTNVGSVTSQGLISHGANKVNAMGVTGAGVRVGVLSDSASAGRVAALIASGDLPANTVVLPGQAGPAGGADEGTAMMEIVHDLAPDAQLFFATADNGVASFAANIQALRFTYGCDIIVDDVSYFNEGVFQDGPIAQAVNVVTANGALYFSAAANSGNLDSGTSGTWEGDFTPSGYSLTTAKGVVLLNNFGTVATPSWSDQLTSPESGGVWLHWADPNGGSTNDYDLFILNAAGTTVKAASVGVQTGTQDPLESVYPNSTFTAAAGDRILVALASGAARAIHIDTERATLAVGTSGATFGHNAAASTFTMAATYWNAARTGAKIFTGGPRNPVEPFSSDGPRQIFYNPDGTAITPGNFLFSTRGGTTLQKPDATAADGGSTATPGFTPFFGTSAAAPHAAAVAALVKSANPALTNTQIRNILTQTALDNMAAGVDRSGGYGLLTAPAAVAAARALATNP